MTPVVQPDEELKRLLTRVSNAMSKMQRSDPSASQVRIDITSLQPTKECLASAMEELDWLSYNPELEEGTRTVITITF